MTRTGTFSRLAFTLALWCCVSCTPESSTKSAFEKGEQEAACYAPGKNLETAYREGSVGCECGSGDPDQCIDGVALICDESGHWRAVIDGPCWDPGPAQPCGDIFCSKYGKCVVLPDGRHACVSTLVDSGVDAGAAAALQAGLDAEAGAEAGSAEAGAEAGSAETGPPGEACGASTCSSYAYCASGAEGATECRAKRNPGDRCSQARTCMSGLCSGGSCQPPADARSCNGTWDCSLSIAETICRGRDCHVCLQGVNAQGEPRTWGAVEPASCPCPLVWAAYEEH